MLDVLLRYLLIGVVGAWCVWGVVWLFGKVDREDVDDR
jgi:putative flippase GtrA